MINCADQCGGTREPRNRIQAKSYAVQAIVPPQSDDKSALHLSPSEQKVAASCLLQYKQTCAGVTKTIYLYALNYEARVWNFEKLRTLNCLPILINLGDLVI